MGSRKKAAVAAASPTDTVAEVGRIFQTVHQSAAHAQRCKKELLSRGAKSTSQLCTDVCAVVLLVLQQVNQITPDAMRRHYTFLVELCKAFRESFETDELAIEVLRCVAPFHNAVDKTVRLAVVATFEALLKTVDQRNASVERQDFYQEAAELLKQRVHDKCPQVRAKAVASAAAFQEGKRTCDVSQQLIALLCCDGNADVRKQVLHAIAPRKEFLDGYFAGMIRCLRDVVARVRAEAWDALGRFPWRYITAYANAKEVRMPELLAAGLDDANASVAIACRATLTNCWVHRDCKDAYVDFVNSIACGYVLPSLLPFERISAELLAYARRRNAAVHFPLQLDDVNTAGLFLWKADCRVSCDTAGEDETELLPPLEQFSAVLQDTVYAYARPDVEPKTVKFRTVEDADNMLRILLSVFDIYDDNAYLVHADNTTRASLLRLINFILKLVPDEDPSLFVDVAVRALQSLTTRTPEEATKTITSALDSLFRSLKLPQRHALGFDDVEAIGRKSRERHQELVRRKVLWTAGEAAEAAYTALKEEMDRDEKFLLRMQLIVLACLSHSQRGDPIPTFSYHIIQMGRHLDNERVRVAATQSLCLQCLINPESVHTFMPLILADARENAAVGVAGAETSLPVAATGVVFDLIMEYGLRFFDSTRRPPPAHEVRPAYNAENEVEARLQHEQELAEEDVHKVGSKRLLATLQSFLEPGNEAKHTVAASGFCKLLSCNRLPADVVPHVVAMLLVHWTGAMASKKDDPAAAYMMDYLGTFFRSYAASHPKRQEQLCEGGVTAFRVVLERNTAMAAKVLELVARLTDAYTLTLIRDIDPQAARRATRDVDGEPAGAARQTDEAQRASHRTSTTRSSMQSGRLLRELSRHSLHERLAQELLIELAHSDLAERRVVCMDALEKCMYFYSREPQPFLHHCAAAATLATQQAAPALRDRLEVWLRELRQRCTATGAAPPSDTAESDAEGAEALAQRWDAAVQARTERRDALLEAGFAGMASIPAQLEAGVTASKAELTEVKRERDADVFDVESIVGPSKRARR